MYLSNSMQTITEDPQKTSCPGVIEFINDTCKFYPGCETIAEEAYDKYIQYCKDRRIKYATFNVFARSFKYYAFHNNMVPNIQMHRVNYTHYKKGVGYVRKSGWAYSNLCITEKPVPKPIYNNRYNPDNAIKDVYKTYIPLLIEFIRDTCKYVKNSHVSPEVAYGIYTQYCNDYNINAANFDSFYKAFSHWIAGARIVHSDIYKYKTKYFRDPYNYNKRSGSIFVNLEIHYTGPRDIYRNAFNNNITLVEPFIYDEPQIFQVTESSKDDNLILPSIIKEW